MRIKQSYRIDTFNHTCKDAQSNKVEIIMERSVIYQLTSGGVKRADFHPRCHSTLLFRFHSEITVTFMSRANKAFVVSELGRLVTPFWRRV